MIRPLQAIRVLDLSRLLPGGLATLMLADLGADVVKIEQPERGDYLRDIPPQVAGHGAIFALLNRGKRSLTLDLKTAAGSDLLKRLVTGADVLIESFRPGVMQRMGLAWPVLQAVQPRLIYVALTGYGQSGPRAARSGHDLNFLALSGALDLLADEEGRPVVPGWQAADLAGGSLLAVVAILAALAERERTGVGRMVDVAMLDGLFSLLPVALGMLWGGQPPTHGRTPLSGALANYHVYRTADGRWLALAALEPQFWQRFCEAVGREDLLAAAFDPRPAAQAALRATLTELFAARPLDEWLARLGEVDACCDPVYSLPEALCDPHIAALGPFCHDPAAAPEQRYRLAFPVRFDGERPAAAAGPVPRLGQHSDEILSQLGLSAADIAELRTRGVV